MYHFAAVCLPQHISRLWRCSCSLQATSCWSILSHSLIRLACPRLRIHNGTKSQSTNGIVSMPKLAVACISSYPLLRNVLPRSTKGRMLSILIAAPPSRRITPIDASLVAPCTSSSSLLFRIVSRVAQPGAYMDTVWETCQTNNANCLLDASTPNNTAAFLPPRVCSQGSVPLASVCIAFVHYYVMLSTDVRHRSRFKHMTTLSLPYALFGLREFLLLSRIRV